MLKIIKNSKGSAVVETAIMFPLVLMLTFGFIMFTQAIRINTVLEVAAREAARTYSLTNNSSLATQKARAELALGGVPNAEQATIGLSSSGYDRKVTVDLPYNFHIPFAGGGFVKALRGSAVFHLEPNPAHY
ncbi:MAG: hypothetical protein PWQ18_671 [Clostridia bacterium]|nr:hypothetical protein [Clostridia bacterium]